MTLRPDSVDGYQVYTTKFDRVVAFSEIDSVLGPLRLDQKAALDAAWDTLQTALVPWKTSLHVVAAEAASRLREKLPDAARADTAVTLLFDQSGSMRGQKMLFAAATADVVQEFILTLRITCEVLGFTTSRWRGGRSRRRWTWHFRPSNPGRLNDLLHIIYRDASDRRASTGSWNFRPMLRADLPKENVDGEAILWATERLSQLQARRKVLIVLSDGAPVDDSTLLANGNSYLSDHLRQVVDGVATKGDIKFAALGIGYKAHDFYPVSSYIEAPDELGSALIQLLEEVLMP